MTPEPSKNTKSKMPREDMLSPRHTPAAVRKRPPKKLMRTLRLSMLVLSFAILLLTALLVILPMFRVQKVEVEGNSYYQYEEILKASGITLGEDESLALDGEMIAKKILKACPNIKTCTVMKLPFSVKITIVEKADVKTTAYNGGYITFDRNFLVLEEDQNGEAFSPFLSVTLPQLAGATVGKQLQFYGMTLADAAYINTLYDTLKEKELLSQVTHIDYSERFALSYVLDDRIRVELGSMDSLEKKLDKACEMLEKKQEGGTDLNEVFAVLDVSDLQKSTWREVQSLNELE